MTELTDLIPAPTPQAIQDAILFGHVAELDVVLAGMEGEEKLYQDDLRYGLEALRHFRAWYGPHGEMPPTTHLQKQTIAVLESSWSAELLDMLRQHETQAAGTSPSLRIVRT